MQAPLLEVRFGRSPSVNYALAVRLAKSLPGYQGTGADKAVVHEVVAEKPLPENVHWEALVQLLRLIKGWDSARVKISGESMWVGLLSLQLSDVQACYAQKRQQGAGDDYCSGKSAAGGEASAFGCRLVRGISRRTEGVSYQATAWFQVGGLAPGRDRFQVDKEAIFTNLQEQNRFEACVLCPAFRWQRVRAVVDALPAVIPLGGDSKFEIRFAPHNPTQPLGIQLKQPTTTVTPTVRPNGPTNASPEPVRSVPNVRYADVAGHDNAVAAVQNVVQLPLSHGAYFEALGVEPQTGILLYGPPGNGKTLLAKAVATEANAHFEIINGPEILSPWLGQSEGNLRRIFARARQLAPSVVLLDELDAIAPRRELAVQHHEIQIVAQLLVLLDGLEARGRVAVIGTTNRLEGIDPALLRPGRLDYHLEVPGPDFKGRLAILRVCLRKLKIRHAFALEGLAEATEDFSGAELAALCREAGLVAIHRGLASAIPAERLAVTRQDLQQALLAFRAKRAPHSPKQTPALSSSGQAVRRALF
jgi:transitional endoplasmic reticulum ATPase